MLCGITYASCVCLIGDPEHTTPHVCSCGGSWTGKPDEPNWNGEIIIFPNGLNFAEVLGRMLGGFSD